MLTNSKISDVTPKLGTETAISIAFIYSNFISDVTPKLGTETLVLYVGVGLGGEISDVTPKLGTETKHYLMIPIEQIIKILSPK